MRAWALKGQTWVPFAPLGVCRIGSRATPTRRKLLILRREIVAEQEHILWNAARSIAARDFEFTDAEVASIKGALQTWESNGVAADRKWHSPQLASLFAAEVPMAF